MIHSGAAVLVCLHSSSVNPLQILPSRLIGWIDLAAAGRFLGLPAERVCVVETEDFLRALRACLQRAGGLRDRVPIPPVQALWSRRTSAYHQRSNLFTGAKKNGKTRGPLPQANRLWI
jgi:hypothetical protein